MRDVEQSTSEIRAAPFHQDHSAGGQPGVRARELAVTKHGRKSRENSGTGARFGVERAIGRRPLHGTFHELDWTHRLHAERFERRAVGSDSALDRDLGKDDRALVLMTRARRVKKVLGHDPGPCGYGRRRQSAREDARDAIRLACEERQELHLERVIWWDALQGKRTLDPVLAEANALDLHQRVLGDKLASDIAHVGAKAPRHERRERVLAHAVISPSSIARFESSSAAAFSSRGTWRISRSGNEARSSAARSARGMRPGCLMRQSPRICWTTRSESMHTSIAVAPRRLASSSPRISALYSATLFVA